MAQRPATEGGEVERQLCLARAIGIWGDDSMPPRMTSRTEIGGRPPFCFGTEKMRWRPMMIFSTLSAAHFTDERKLHRVQLLDFYPRTLDHLAPCISLCTPSATNAHKRVFRFSAGICIEPNAPSETTAMLTSVRRVLNFIFPGGVSHEATPILRK